MFKKLLSLVVIILLFSSCVNKTNYKGEIIVLKRNDIEHNSKVTSDNITKDDYVIDVSDSPYCDALKDKRTSINYNDAYFIGDSETLKKGTEVGKLLRHRVIFGDIGECDIFKGEILLNIDLKQGELPSYKKVYYYFFFPVIIIIFIFLFIGMIFREGD